MPFFRNKLFPFTIRRNFIYAAMIGLVIGGYLFSFFTVQSFFKYNPDIFIIVDSIAVLIAAIGFAPLEKKLQVLTDKVFFKKCTGYQDTIFRMIREMVSCLDLELFKKLIVDILYNEMRVSSLGLYLRSADKKKYTLVKHKKFKGARAYLAEEELINSLQTEQKIILNYGQKVIVPFIEQDQLIGFLSLGKKLSGDEFFSEDIKLLEAISHQCVIGLQNARLYATSQAKVKELTTLLELSKIISSTLDSEQILKSVIRLVVEVVGVDRGILFLFDQKKEELYSAAGYGASKKNIFGITLPIGDSVLGRVFKAGNPVYIPKTTRNTEYVKRLGVRSYIVVPMKAKDKVIGLLAVDNATTRKSLESVNMEYLSLLGGQMAVAIENAKLYEEAKEKLQQLSDLNASISQLQNYNQNILMTMPAGIITFDNHGKIKTFNSTAEQILDLPVIEVLDKKRQEIWKEHPHILEAVSKECSNLEMNFKNKEDKILTLNINTKALHDNQNKKIGLLSVITDMSEIKLLEKQVRRSDRVTALGTMVAGIAHEIKNPLTSLKLFIQLMEENKNNPDFWEEYGSIIANEVSRLETIVENFLGFARTKEVEMKNIKFREIMQNLYQLVKTQCSKENVEIIIDVDQEIVVRADQQKMMQVFLNLVLNAIQAMPVKHKEKGRVVILSELDLKNNQVRISVADNGAGISKENLEKLFIPFYTTKQKGTGLGLSIVHKIIEEHEGSIQVESEPGKGTVFYITLPLVTTGESLPLKTRGIPTLSNWPA